MDRRYLPAGEPEFVVWGDTHYMLEKPDVEFASRRRQTERIEYAIDRINALEPDFVVHLGDLVQEYPESGAYDEAMAAALDQLDRLDPPVRFVPGNHDVGDKPDPTMPTDWVSTASLERYHELVGPSWAAWEAGGCHFVSLNSQLMNTSLDAAADQRAWIEDQLARIENGPIFVFLHLPPYLDDADDPGLGHYDVIDEPARSWLLEQVRTNPVAAVFAGHCHFEFLDRIGDAEFRVVPSVSFTRPGFAELFSSGPPPERGRDEAAKLGLYFVRVIDGEPIVRRIRTGGRTDRETAGMETLLPRGTAELPASPIGVSLAYPLSTTTEIPETFPSSVRYSVSNAYPTLGCLGMGIGTVRLPLAEIGRSASERYLDELQAHGATLVGTVLAGSGRIDTPPERIDELEVRLPPDRGETGDRFAPVAAASEHTGIGCNLSRVVPKRDVAGKQHGRLRNGFAVDDLPELDRRLAANALTVDRVTCRVRDGIDPWPAVTDGPTAAEYDRIGGIDWLLSSMNASMPASVDRIARAVAAVATRTGERIYLEPLRAMDRTMDPAPGLLDRRCNPTAGFQTVACLNTLLFRSAAPWSVVGADSQNGVELIGLQRSETGVWLALPGADGGEPTVSLPLEDGASVELLVSLADGRCCSPETADAVTIEQPIVVVTRQ